MDKSYKSFGRLMIAIHNTMKMKGNVCVALCSLCSAFRSKCFFITCGSNRHKRVSRIGIFEAAGLTDGVRRRSKSAVPLIRREYIKMKWTKVWPTSKTRIAIAIYWRMKIAIAIYLRMKIAIAIDWTTNNSNKIYL